jgi:LPS-assembly lipoprotein
VSAVRRARRIWLRQVVALAAAAVSGCGFALRGQPRLPFSTLYISGPPKSQVVNDLRRQLRGNGTVRLTERAEDAEAQLQVTGDAREKIILSLTGQGKVREYQLRQRVAYRVINVHGVELTPPSEILVTRVLNFSDTEVLAKEAEEVLLYRDMDGDAVMQLLRRLAAIPPGGVPQPAS